MLRDVKVKDFPSIKGCISKQEERLVLQNTRYFKTRQNIVLPGRCTQIFEIGSLIKD